MYTFFKSYLKDQRSNEPKSSHFKQSIEKTNITLKDVLKKQDEHFFSVTLHSDFSYKNITLPLLYYGTII